MFPWLAYGLGGTGGTFEIPVLIISGTAAEQQVPESDVKSLNAAYPEAELLIIEGMNHVLKIVSNEVKNETVFTTPDLALSDGFREGIIQFLK